MPNALQDQLFIQKNQLRRINGLASFMMSMSNKPSPKIKKPQIPPRELRGSGNTSPLRKSGGDKRAVSKSYDEIAGLSAQLDSLKKEYDELTETLNSMLSAEELTPFCQFKKWENELNQRFDEREGELATFAKYIGSFRKQPDPTFVEVDAALVKPLRYDSITASLLVANPERTFFNNNDLADRNRELHTLIQQQDEKLKLLAGRLKMFTRYQHANSAAAAVESLKKGEMPMPFTGDAPTKSSELKTKKKLLTTELAALVEIRKGLLAEKWQKRLEMRKLRFMVKMAVTIQRVVRGFFVRQSLKRSHQAATKIQSVWRGWHVRTKATVAEQPCEETGPQSETSEEVMKPEEAPTTIQEPLPETSEVRESMQTEESDQNTQDKSQENLQTEEAQENTEESQAPETMQTEESDENAQDKPQENLQTEEARPEIAQESSPEISNEENTREDESKIENEVTNEDAQSAKRPYHVLVEAADIDHPPKQKPNARDDSGNDNELMELVVFEPPSPVNSQNTEESGEHADE